MATKKNKPKSYNLAAQQYGQRYSNALSEASSIAEQLRAQGETVTPEDEETIADQIATTGQVNWTPRRKAAPSTSLESMATSDRVPEARAYEPSFFENLTSRSPSEIAGDFGSALRAAARRGLADLLEAPASAYNASLNAPSGILGKTMAEALGLPTMVDQPEFVKQEAARLRRESGDILTERTPEAIAGQESLQGADGFFGTLGQLAQNPLSGVDFAGEQIGQLLPSIAGGGPEGMVVLQGLQAANNSANEVKESLRKKGITGEAADKAASSSFLSSLAINTALPKVLPGGTAFESLVTRGTAGAAGRNALIPLAGESLSEGITEGLDQLQQNVFSGDPAMQGVGNAAALGMAAGGATGGAASIRAAQENSMRRAVDTAELTNAVVFNRDAAIAADRNRNAELNRELFYAERDLEGTPTQDISADVEAAYRQREQEQARQKALEEEAGFQTIERDRNLPADRVERYGTSDLPEEVGRGAQVVERVPVNPPAPISAGEIEAQQQLEQLTTAEQNRRARLEQQARAVAARREKLEAARQKAEKERTAAQKRADTKRRNDITDQLIRENPTATDEEIANLVEQRLAQPEPQPQVQQPTTEAAPVPAQQAPAPVEQSVATETPAIDVRELFRQQTGIQVPDADQSLAMRAVAVPAKPAQDFAPRAERLVKDLVKRNTKESEGVQNLIRQGKLIITDNPESVGRRNETDQAEYDINEAKMYLYLDRMSESNAVPAIIAALHESTHAGQFNERQGRSSILQEMMSKDKENAASSAIRRAAAGGNEVARRAVQLAQDANPNENIQNLELVPYFVSEAAARRTGTLGALRGVATDIVAAGRSFVRNRLGVDLDINLQDIDAAIKQIPNEIVQTDLTPSSGQPLGMILGANARNIQQARNEGFTFRGARDNGERFEISDADVELEPQAIEDLRNGQTVTLGELMNHRELFDNYPRDLEYIDVVPDRTMIGDNDYGAYDPNRDQILVNPRVLTGEVPRNLRNLILHETQHAVQRREGFVAGANPASFMPTSVINRLNRAEDRLNDVISKFDLGRAIQKLPDNWKRVWDNINNAYDLNTRDAKARKFLEEGFVDEINDRLLKRHYELYKNAQEEYDSAKEAYYNAEDRAFDTYLRSYSETEARNTEYRSRTPLNELRENPPESTMQFASGNIPVERTIDTTPYVRSRTPAPAASRLAELRNKGVENMTQDEQVEYANLISEEGDPVQSLGMSMSVTPDSIEQIKARSPKEQMFRILRHQTNYRTADINSAELAFNQMERAINKTSRNTGVDIDTINKDVNKQLASMDNMDSAEQKVAWNEFNRKYPEIAPYVKSVRDMIDRNTLAIVKARLDDPRPTTPAEDKEIRNLLANRGKYMHRAYAAFQGRTGREFASARMEGFRKATELLDKNKQIPAKLREHYDATIGAINFLTDRIQIPDRADLEASNVDSLEKLYETWIGPLNTIPYDASAPNASAQRKALMIQSLDNVRADITPDMIRNEAEKIASSIIGITDANSGFGQSFSELARDTGVLRHRENVPPEIRRFLGEYTDPAARVLTTLAAQAGYLARARALAEIKREGNGTLVVDKATARQPGNEDFSVELKGEQYGPLQGWYALPEVADRISTVTTMTHSWEQAWNEFGSDPSILTNKLLKAGVKGLRRASGAQKIATVVANPYKWLRNFVGSPLMAIRDGNINLATWGTGFFKGARDYVANTWNGSVSDRLDSYVRYLGIESARVAEVQRILGSTLEDVIKGKRNAGNTAMAKIKRAGRTAIAGYSMADAWTKIANFENRASILRNFYEAAGIPKTEEQILQEAGDDTNYTNISYDRAANIVRGLEKAGVSQYLPYFSEVFRTTATNYVQALADIKRATNPNLPPKAAAIMMYAGMSRFIGNTLVTFGMPYALSLLGAALSGGDDDDWRRNLVSEFNKNQDLLYFGTNSEGMPVFLPVSMADPIGPVTDLMRTWMFTAGGETDKAKALLKQMTGMYVAPSWVGRMYDAITRTTQPEPRLARMMPNLYSQFVRSLENIGVDGSITNRAVFATESWMPDWLKSFDPRTQPDIDGNFSSQTLSALGAQFEVLNPQRRLLEANVKQRDKRSKALNNVNVLLSNTPDLTGNELKSALISFKESEMDRLKDLYNLRVSLEKWGQNEATIRDMLKKAGYAKGDIEAIYSPNPTARLSIKSLEQYVDKKNTGVSAQEANRRSTIAAENLRKLKASRDFLAELGVTLEN